MKKIKIERLGYNAGKRGERRIAAWEELCEFFWFRNADAKAESAKEFNAGYMAGRKEYDAAKAAAQPARPYSDQAAQAAFRSAFAAALRR